ncbi:MAG: nuclear transport factor 2 family protein [Alphaproteobacteria bacterium]|jgi:hypothetical protein|nr:nuclear transport factor 2 family protein [Alphaproteobacteria bacterium]
MKKIIRQKPIKLLMAFCQHYSARDLKAMLSIFTPDAIVWGTGADEIRRGLTQIESQLLRDWSQSDSCAFVIEKTELDEDNPNWIGAILKVNVTMGGVIHPLTMRLTTITKRVDGIEKIHFCHGSFPEKYQEIGKSFPEESLMC